MRFFHYKYPVERLHSGSSPGNRYAFVQLDKRTIDIFVNGKPLFPTETEFQPEAQTTFVINGDASAGSRG